MNLSRDRGQEDTPVRASFNAKRRNADDGSSSIPSRRMAFCAGRLRIVQDALHRFAECTPAANQDCFVFSVLAADVNCTFGGADIFLELIDYAANPVGDSLFATTAGSEGT